MIRDRFVVGLRGSKLSETLQFDVQLTLASTVAKARLKETVHEQQHQLRNNDSLSVTTMEIDVDVVEKKNTSSQPLRKEHLRHHIESMEPQGKTQRCLLCGQTLHPRPVCLAKQQSAT